jgi:hypothetical protein
LDGSCHSRAYMVRDRHRLEREKKANTVCF